MLLRVGDAMVTCNEENMLFIFLLTVGFVIDCWKPFIFVSDACNDYYDRWEEQEQPKKNMMMID